MFGTFAAERKDEKIVYGLVDQPQFFNPMRHQMFYYGKVFEKAASMNTIMEKIKALVFGPGWFPGTGRLGDPMGVPKVQDRKKYNPIVPSWMNVYVGKKCTNNSPCILQVPIYLLCTTVLEYYSWRLGRHLSEVVPGFGGICLAERSSFQ